MVIQWYIPWIQEATPSLEALGFLGFLTRSQRICPTKERSPRQLDNHALQPESLERLKMIDGSRDDDDEFIFRRILRQS